MIPDSRRRPNIVAIKNTAMVARFNGVSEYKILKKSSSVEMVDVKFSLFLEIFSIFYSRLGVNGECCKVSY